MYPNEPPEYPYVLSFDEYQDESSRTAIYPEIGHGCIYPIIGLVNEVGEVLGKVKKIFRDNNGVFDQESIEKLKSEIGDSLWYLFQFCNELDIDVNEVALMNLKKLKSRQERGKLQGDGDER